MWHGNLAPSAALSHMGGYAALQSCRILRDCHGQPILQGCSTHLATGQHAPQFKSLKRHSEEHSYLRSVSSKACWQQSQSSVRLLSGYIEWHKARQAGTWTVVNFSGLATPGLVVSRLKPDDLCEELTFL